MAEDSSAASLEPYRRKRDFSRTPEPAPATPTAAGQGYSFVVQKHAARRLHYDFRLELDGVLKSWAVAKGPSLDPAVKRLAVHVEDHPLEYGGFEGVIPKGEYGGGTVMIWDQGRWEPDEDPEKTYPKGKLAFRLFGKRLKGAWKLVGMGGRAGEEGKNWLLIKVADGEARPGEGDQLIDADTSSVISERSMTEIAKAADRVWSSASKDAAKSVSWPHDLATLGEAATGLPDFVPPALATLVDKPPAGDGWLHEIKFDGYRMQCRIDHGQVRLSSRTGLDWTNRFRAIATAAAALPTAAAVVDGEIVALQASGVSSFSLLQQTLKGGPTDQLVYYVFDLLFLEGRDLRGLPVDQRKGMLQALIPATDGLIRYSDHYIADGQPFFESACRMALEGIISKRIGSPYPSGRSRDWLKSKCVERQEFVIGGFTKPSTGVRGVGSLLLGYHQDGKLVYVGRVGTGFDAATSLDLRKRLDELPASQSPFAKIDSAARRDAIWVQPELVCEIEFRSWTHDGRLRHASFQGLRDDKPAALVQLEGTPVAAENETAATRARIIEDSHLTHPDRVLYPQQGLTKRGLAEYYVDIADWILPHVADRPLSLVRCPSGEGKECFYQKHIAKGLPAGMSEVMISESKGEKAYPVLDGVDGLIALVQLGVLEIHPWGTTSRHVEQPDRLIFDFDPDPTVGWDSVVTAAREMRERLAGLGLQSFVKTTGGKGLHVVVPITPELEWPEVKRFCESVAEACVRDSPDRYTANLSKAARTGKIFVDYLRNGRGATAIAPYSPRARPNAPVATPLAWEELGTEVTSDFFTVQSLPRRLQALARDPWQEMSLLRQSIAGLDAKKSRRRK